MPQRVQATLSKKRICWQFWQENSFIFDCFRVIDRPASIRLRETSYSRATMAIRVASNTHLSLSLRPSRVAAAARGAAAAGAPLPDARFRSYSLRVTPAEHFLNWQQDPFGNYQARLVFPQPARELSVEVDLVAELVAINPFDFFVEEYAEKYPVPVRAVAGPGAGAVSRAGRAGARSWRRWPRSCAGATYCPGRRSVDVLVDINREVQRALRYDIRMEPGVFSPEETLERGHGSCRDFAWLVVQRAAPAGVRRPVRVGLLDPAAGRREAAGRARRACSEDVADLHAWAEVYLPGAGWIGLDATSGLLAGRGTSRSPAPPRRHGRADHRVVRLDREGRGRQGLGGVRLRDEGARGSTSRRASPSPTARSSGPAIDRARGRRSIAI